MAKKEIKAIYLLIFAIMICMQGCKAKTKLENITKTEIQVKEGKVVIITDKENDNINIMKKYEKEVKDKTGNNIIIYNKGKNIGIIANENAADKFSEKLGTLNNIAKLACQDEKARSVDDILTECKERVISLLY